MSEANDNSRENNKRGYLVPSFIIEKARKCGIALADLQVMVRQSTRVTSEHGNRRYHDVYFMVEGNRVMDIVLVDSTQPKEVVKSTEEKVKQFKEVEKKRADCTFCNDTKKIRAFDECAYCEGTGCKYCDEGLVPSFIPCPMCVNRSVLSKKVVS